MSIRCYKCSTDGFATAVSICPCDGGTICPRCYYNIRDDTRELSCVLCNRSTVQVHGVGTTAASTDEKELLRLFVDRANIDLAEGSDKRLRLARIASAAKHEIPLSSYERPPVRQPVATTTTRGCVSSSTVPSEGYYDFVQRKVVTEEVYAGYIQTESDLEEDGSCDSTTDPIGDEDVAWLTPPPKGGRIPTYDVDAANEADEDFETRAVYHY